MFRQNRQLLLFAISLLVFFLAKVLVDHLALSAFRSMEVTLESDHADRLVVYYRHGSSARFSARRLAASEEFAPNRRVRVVVDLNNHPARSLRIDPGDKSGRIIIHQLELESHFGSTIVLTPRDIHRLFKPNADISLFQVSGSKLVIEVTGNDPSLFSDHEFAVKNPLLSYGLPMALALLFWLWARNLHRSDIPAWHDMNHHQSSASISYASLDGIRGIAVLLVLLDHTMVQFVGAGRTGVWIFFVLSGFLLSIPFVRQPALAASPDYMGEYLLRRVKRIVPMYYFMIITTFLLFGNVQGSTFRHLMFLQGDGHLWTIPQEMLFYLFLPFIMVANHWVLRGRPWWIAGALSIVMILANEYFGRSVFSLYGQSTQLPAYVGIFLCGIIFSYLYHGYLEQRVALNPLPNPLRQGLSIAGITLLCAMVLLSIDLFFEQGTFYSEKLPGWFGLGAGLMILLALLTPGTVYHRFVSLTPLRALGIVGYSFYLIHPVVIPLVVEIQDFFLGYQFRPYITSAIVLVVAYTLSIFTYAYIERPFLKRAGRSPVSH